MKSGNGKKTITQGTFSDQLLPFGYKKIGNKHLLINEWGDYLFLSATEFDCCRKNHFDQNTVLYKRLQEKNFLRTGLDMEAAQNRYRLKKHYLFSGPGLHIIVVTLRCNQNCLYCDAGARRLSESGYDMTKETAGRVLDIIFASANKFAAIEFQGGEPLLNWPVAQYIIEEARRRNRKAKKDLEIRLVTNGGLMTDKIYRFLIKERVSFCFSYDGVKEVHNRQRCGQDGDNHKTVASWIKKMKKNEVSNRRQGYRWPVNTRLTVTKFSFPRYREIIDEYVRLGLDSVYLHYLQPFNIAKSRWRQIGYKAEEFLNFYRQTVDCILEKNKKGKIFRERMTSLILEKIFAERDPNLLDLRSPCGAGIGQLAYNYDGEIYSCDEGRMLASAGDHAFRIGNVFSDFYKDLATSPVTKTLCAASCLEALPECEMCLYRPYCGVCPVYNYYLKGDIFSRSPNNDRCRIYKGMMDYIFSKLENKKTAEVLRRWVINR
jgi:uncharacterized protein